MLTLKCPYCDVQTDETELTAHGEAHVARAAPDANDDAFSAYLFERANPVGLHFEIWRHAYGCGKFFNVARNTKTHEVYGTYPVQTLAPPKELMDRLQSSHPHLFAP